MMSAIVENLKANEKLNGMTDKEKEKVILTRCLELIDSNVSKAKVELQENYVAQYGENNEDMEYDYWLENILTMDAFLYIVREYDLKLITEDRTFWDL